LSLLSGLRVSYRFEEATGASRIDDVGGHTLTDHATVARVAGKLGPGPYAAGFTVASSQYLSCASHADFQIDKTGSDGFTGMLWVYPTLGSTVQGIVSKGFLNGDSKLEWQLIQRQQDDCPSFYVSYNGSMIMDVVGLIPYTLNSWNFTRFWYRSSDGQIGIQLNCGTKYTSALSPNTPFTGDGDFNVGRIFDNFATYYEGRIDSLLLYQRLLTDDEVCSVVAGSSIYSSGNGLDWPFAGGGGMDQPLLYAVSQQPTLSAGSI
jgi:hypothetical protein